MKTGIFRFNLKKYLILLAEYSTMLAEAKETGEDFQATHLLPVASMEKGSSRIFSI